jgi:predicted GNAT family acetyltransferase
MKARLVEHPSEFLEAAGPFLAADEARHNLILGLASTLDGEQSPYVEHRLWVVEHAGKVVGAALRTPPWPLVLGQPTDDTALAVLVDAIGDDLPGVVGSRPEVEAFSNLWTTATGATARVKVEQGVYALSTLFAVPVPSGAPQAATRDDRPLLVEWWEAFAIEAVHDDNPDAAEIEEAVDYRLDDLASGFLLWEDNEIVSLAGYGGRTPNGIRIGPVYTPPERRGRGYASALVAALSERCLAAGNRFCFLYTDLANPTSNAIYRRIGYEQVCESAEIEFTPAS